jgi:hypothetical protein
VNFAHLAERLHFPPDKFIFADLNHTAAGILDPAGFWLLAASKVLIQLQKF